MMVWMMDENRLVRVVTIIDEWLISGHAGLLIYEI